MKETRMQWALSAEIKGGRRLVNWGELSWHYGNMAKRIRLFHSREDARYGQQNCDHIKTRVEKVQVTVEVVS